VDLPTNGTETLDRIGRELLALPDWAWVLGGVLAFALLAAVVVTLQRRADRRARLRAHFSSEYARMLLEGRRRHVEDALEQRLDRRRDVRAVPVSLDEADRLRGLLDDLLVGFVDAPPATTDAAGEVAAATAAARGYRTGDGGHATDHPDVEESLDLVSVDHPDPVAAVRRAEQRLRAAGDADGATEAARRVVIAARALVDLLLAAAGDVDVRDVLPPERRRSDVTRDGLVGGPG
jgi:hypothetical protein